MEDKIIAEYTKLGELVSYEMSLGVQMIKLTEEQRKAHRAVIDQNEVIRSLKD